MKLLSNDGWSELALVWSQRRRSVARVLAWLAGFSATALLVVPKGLSVFAAFMLMSTLAVLPDAWRRRPTAPGAIYLLLGVAVAALTLSAGSMWASGADASALDNVSRLLLLPWCAWLAWITRVQISCLRYGALAGLALAFFMSMAQMGLGAARAGGEINPIVFANAVLVLLVVTVCCGSARDDAAERLLTTLAVAMGIVAVTLSGSRGALLGLMLVVLVFLLAGAQRRGRCLGMSMIALFATGLVLVWTMPWLSTQFRLDQVWTDVAGYPAGQVDQPISARLGLIAVAWDAFREAPLTGIGIGGFAQRVDASGHCLDASRHFCSLEHAHNDLAQWGATMGVPGVVALLAVYLVPLAIAVRQMRGTGSITSTGPARGAGMLVVVYLLSGLTQSMFSHALATSAYVVLVGWLLGMSAAEDAE